MDKATAMIRSVCQPKFKIPDNVADEMKNGVFPDDKTSKVLIYLKFYATVIE